MERADVRPRADRRRRIANTPASPGVSTPATAHSRAPPTHQPHPRFPTVAGRTAVVDPGTPRRPQGTGRVQQLRRTTLRHTPARCHRAPPRGRGDGPTYIHERRRPTVRLQ